MLGRAFPDEAISTLSIDLLNVYFWAALGEVARDYAWKDAELSLYADYLQFPLEITGLAPIRTKDAA
jgi:hypothetical protein